jgi:hypothetical protein
MGEAFLALGAFLLPAIIGVIGCAVAGFFMLDRFERGVTGALLGFFLGPIGLVIAWVMRSNAMEEERGHQARHATQVDAVMRNVIDPEPSVGRSSAPIDELERLAALRDKGHLTAEEFDREKRRVLEQQSEQRRR